MSQVANAAPTVPNPLDKTMLDFGAFGDGVHDDTEAVRRSLEYACAGHSLRIPEGTFVVSSISVCRLTGTGTRVYGSGPQSTIWNIGDSGALQFTYGTITTAYNNLYLDNFRIHNDSQRSPFALQLYNVASFGILNVDIDGSGSTSDLVSFVAAQQGYFKGGTLTNGTNAFHLEGLDLGPGVGVVNSNMIDISSVEINNCTGDGGSAIVLGGQDDGNFFGNHITSCAIGVRGLVGGDGQYNVFGNHFEPITPGLSRGQFLIDPGYMSLLLFAGNTIYVYPGEVAIDSAGLGTQFVSNTIDGDIFFRPAASKNQFVSNRYYGALNDSSSGLIRMNNDFE